MLQTGRQEPPTTGDDHMRRRDFLTAIGLSTAAGASPIACAAFHQSKLKSAPKTITVWSTDDISGAVGNWEIPATSIQGLEPYTAMRVADAQIAAVCGDDGLRDATFTEEDGLWMLAGTFGHHGQAVICLCPADPDRAETRANEINAGR